MKRTPAKTPIMLAGQVTWSPTGASLNGRLVADGILYPPSEIGIMNETVSFELKGGRIVSIEGGKEARLSRNWIEQLNDDTMYRMAHISMGFNRAYRCRRAVSSKTSVPLVISISGLAPGWAGPLPGISTSRVARSPSKPSV